MALDASLSAIYQSQALAVSAGGRYVLFASAAPGLTTPEPPLIASRGYLYLRDRAGTPPEAAPVARASGPYLGWASAGGATVTLDASGSVSKTGAPLTASWTFGDGTPDASGAASDPLAHTYAGAGTYTATLVVSDGARASAPASAQVEVQPASTGPVLRAIPACSTPGKPGGVRGGAAAARDAPRRLERRAGRPSAAPRRAHAPGDALARGDGPRRRAPRAGRDHRLREPDLSSGILDARGGHRSGRLDRGHLPVRPRRRVRHRDHPVRRPGRGAARPAGRRRRPVLRDRGECGPARCRRLERSQGLALEYAWDLGDATTTVGSSVDHVYESPGTYQATLQAGTGPSSRGATPARRPRRWSSSSRPPRPRRRPPPRPRLAPAAAAAWRAVQARGCSSRSQRGARAGGARPPRRPGKPRGGTGAPPGDRVAGDEFPPACSACSPS